MFRKFGDEIAVVLERFRAGVGGCELPRSITGSDAQHLNVVAVYRERHAPFLYRKLPALADGYRCRCATQSTPPVHQPTGQSGHRRAQQDRAARRQVALRRHPPASRFARSRARRCRRTTDSPSGLGRCGERVANTPLRPDVLRGGKTFGRHPGLRWNQKITQMNSHPARSSSACSKFLPPSSSIRPGLPLAALGCRAASAFDSSVRRLEVSAPDCTAALCVSPLVCAPRAQRQAALPTSLDRDAAQLHGWREIGTLCGATQQRFGSCDWQRATEQVALC